MEMDTFPRTTVGGLSVSRMVIGTNWFLGYSHCTAAKDAYIQEQFKNPKAIADILEVFFRAGVDTIIGAPAKTVLIDGIREAQDRTGIKAIIVGIPTLPVTPKTPVEGFENSEVEKRLDLMAKQGVAICMPHQLTTDAMVDRCTRRIRKMGPVCRMIRERGMIPGLSTHMPETIIYADETALDVETYISIYNTMGFLMQIEVDWVARSIANAKHPVMTIKPMAAGQLRPLQALTFVWNTIRTQDMVAVGTMSAKEAAELIELSLSILEGKRSETPLQQTRSKASVSPQVL